MITRREMMNGTIGAAFAALIAGGASPLLGAETQQNPSGTHGLPGGPAIRSLMKEPLAHTPNPIVNVITLEMAPGEVSPPHKHTGPVFAYILEGEIENQVLPGNPEKYGVGDYFYEPPMHEHKMMKNLSSTRPAKLVIFQVEQKDKPFTIPMGKKA